MRRGFETRFLKQLPEIHLAVLVPSLVIAVFSSDAMTSVLAIGVGVAWGLLLIPAAIACMILAVLKGPARPAGHPGHEPDGDT